MSIYDVFSGGNRPFDKEEWAAAKQAQRKEAYELIDNTCSEMMASGDSFRQYLDVQGCFDPSKEYTREDGTKGVSYNAKVVYDISETSAKDRQQEQEPKSMRELVSALIDASPVPCVPVGELELPAYYDSSQQTIFVKKGLSEEVLFVSIPEVLTFPDFPESMRKWIRRRSRESLARCVMFWAKSRAICIRVWRRTSLQRTKSRNANRRCRL